jgi:DNA-binding CsgD family transcriptional regulator/tetratricopeptide (TPR) repeat protein
MVARASEVFVGRVRALGEFEGALDAAREGSGTTVLIAGEAGIGKTALASEFARRAREAGFDILLGRSIDLVGTELPYQPFVEALGPLRSPRRVDGRVAGSQLQVFEQTLALLTERAGAAPVLLVLEDLHWADASTLDLVVFLAHNLDDRRVLVLVTYRDDEASSATRLRRVADGVRRSGAALVLELGPLEPEELAALLEARADTPLPAGLSDAIVARSEGNPLFAEELLAAAGDRSGALPRGLRELLFRRVTPLARTTQGLLRLAAAAGREVCYPLLRAVAGLPEHDVRESLRQAVEHGVLVAEHATGSFRFRHALLAQAIYTTILPGEREELHARLADELAGAGATAAELAPHWAAAGRATEALSTSVEAAREAEAAFGLAEALAHLERALALWEAVPDAAQLVGHDLAELCSRAAELAGQTGAAPRAVELTLRAIELVGGSDPLRAASLHESLGAYLDASGRTDACLAAFERAVELVPEQPPSPERAQALAALGRGLMRAWRYDASLAISVQALAVARAVRARRADLGALMVLGTDLAYLGRGEEGLAHLWQARQLADKGGAPALMEAYVQITDVLTMLGRPRESARIADSALRAIRPYGIDTTVLVANHVAALLAIGGWGEADKVSAAALRATTANHPHIPLILRADLEIGRGDFDGSRAHLEAARPTLRRGPGLATYQGSVAELALWERRWTDADQAVQDGLEWAHFREAAQIGVRLCAKGLQALAELAALARARRDAGAVRDWMARAQKLIADARRAAAEASAVTPNAAGWHALSEAEYQRARGVTRAELWSAAAQAWDRLERPPLAAYCHWREAEALVAAGASRAAAAGPLRLALAVALRIGASPLLREIELLAQRARLDLTPPEPEPHPRRQSRGAILGLTPREAEVLTLLARGYTDREIAAALDISVKTANVHVSHILRKLGVPNRHEAAAIAHRFTPPRGWQPGFDG